MRYERDIKDLKMGMSITPVDQTLSLFLLAQHSDVTKNHYVRIRCKHRHPIPGYVYCKVSDSYLMRCFQYVNLGSVPVCYRATFHGTGWSSLIPLTERILRRYMTREQRRKSQVFKDTFKEMNNEITFEYVQMLDD